MDNRWVTRQLDLTVFRLESHSQNSIEVHVIPSHERLEADFEIHPGLTLPQGADYQFWRYGARLQTANQRVVALQSQLEMGSFLSGDRQEVTVGLAVRPRVGVVVNVEGEWNRVDLREGRFETRLGRLVADTQFSPWVQLTNTLQSVRLCERCPWLVISLPLDSNSRQRSVSGVSAQLEGRPAAAE